MLKFITKLVVAAVLASIVGFASGSPVLAVVAWAVAVCYMSGE